MLNRRQSGYLETIPQTPNGSTMSFRRPRALSLKSSPLYPRQPGQSHHCRRRMERRLPTPCKRKYHIRRSRCTLLKDIGLPNSATRLSLPSLRRERTAARLLQTMGLQLLVVLRITESGDNSSSSSPRSTSKPIGDTGTMLLSMSLALPTNRVPIPLLEDSFSRTATWLTAKIPTIGP